VSVFGKRIDALNVRVQAKTKSAVVRIITTVARAVINQTPVDKGRLKNNWYASNTRPSTRSNKKTDPSGKKSLARVARAVRRLKLGQTFYLSNNLPYAAVVEYGRYPNPPKKGKGKTINGFSKQAPQGMARIGLKKGMAKVKAVQ